MVASIAKPLSLSCPNNSPPVLSIRLPHTKPRTWPKVEPMANQIQYLGFFATKVQNASTSKKEQAYVGCLLVVFRQLGLTGTSLSMDTQRSNNHSHPHFFRMELLGLLFEYWIFAMSKGLRFVDKLGNDSTKYPAYQIGYSLNEQSRAWHR